MDNIQDQLEDLMKEKTKLYHMRWEVPLTMNLIDKEIFRLQTKNRNPTVLCASASDGQDVYSGFPTAPRPHKTSTPTKKRLKLPIPADRYPEYNFVGRLLGPRGATLKSMEKNTGCKIMIRGKGSIRKDKENEVRGKPGYEHLSNESLHVVIEAEMEDDAAKQALMKAKEEIELLLVPMPEQQDPLKKQQLRDLAMMNGSVRSVAQSVPSLSGFAGMHEMQELRMGTGMTTGGMRIQEGDQVEELNFTIEDVTLDDHLDAYPMSASHSMGTRPMLDKRSRPHDVPKVQQMPDSSRQMGPDSLMRTSQNINITRKNAVPTRGNDWNHSASVPDFAQNGGSTWGGPSFVGLGGVWSSKNVPPTQPGVSNYADEELEPRHANRGDDVGDMPFQLDF